MTDWEDFHSEARGLVGQKGPQCGVSILLKTLPADASEAVRRALDDRTLSTPAIERALRARIGSEAPTPWVLNNHRRGNCLCGREEAR